MNIGEYILPLLTGAAVGSVFALVSAPVPAPPSIQGVLGVVGITIGYMAITYFKG